jgi:hypothetical protein
MSGIEQAVIAGALAVVAFAFGFRFGWTARGRY